MSFRVCVIPDNGDTAKPLAGISRSARSYQNYIKYGRGGTARCLFSAIIRFLGTLKNREKGLVP